MTLEELEDCGGSPKKKTCNTPPYAGAGSVYVPPTHSYTPPATGTNLVPTNRMVYRGESDPKQEWVNPYNYQDVDD